MENTILLYNNALNFNLKQTMNDANDILYNIQSLKQFQWNIDQIQRIKDGAQIQVNMAVLSLWRNYILDEGNAGIILFRNLVRKYYPLNDTNIIKYEILLGEDKGHEWHYITNINAIRRKGEYFSIGNTTFQIDYNNKRLNPKTTKDELQLWDIFYDVTHFDEDSYFKRVQSYVCRHSYSIDFLHEPNRYDSQNLSLNEFTRWSWELVKELKKEHIKGLLKNNGFFAQMGINNAKETLKILQEIVGTSFTITEEMENEVLSRLEEKGIALNSYLPISKDFILQHQDELDWNIMQKNPRIQWDWELIKLYIRKIKETVSEDKWNEYLLGSKAMYDAIENYLNDDILNDIEKLYAIY